MPTEAAAEAEKLAETCHAIFGDPAKWLFLDEVGRDDDCRCSKCKQRKGIVMPLYTTGQRRPTTHGKRRQEVLERDNYICQICGLPTDPNASPPPICIRSWITIIQIVDGGEDKLWNLRTVHKWCNTALSGSPLGEGYVRDVHSCGSAPRHRKD